MLYYKIATYLTMQIFNHVTFSLSINDLKMVQSIPPGGNWQNIPKNIPSKRLERIRETGGRTTLYGRLRKNYPSYTISTYFHRPGNGAYIHPDQDRVISAREAARLQSFPDSYIFEGSKTSLPQQIGNAVPPILAYAIANKIYKLTKTRNVLDLFCGAGGLSLGFKWAGFNIVAANDNSRAACLTYKKNHSSTNLIEGDITDQKIRHELLKASKDTVDIIIGGPPCQGFSYAGKRMIDDPRNFLYKEFVDMVFKIQPRVFLMENVEGILTSNKGATFQNITNDFMGLGYWLHGKKIQAAELGVPQKRKRVVIIGTKNGIDPASCFPSEVLSNAQNYITVDCAIGDLPQIEANGGKNIMYCDSSPNSGYQEFMRGAQTIEDFLSSMSL